jgi:hypothetical protein
LHQSRTSCSCVRDTSFRSRPVFVGSSAIANLRVADTCSRRAQASIAPGYPTALRLPPGTRRWAGNRP